ncbi:MAG: DsrE/DsrF/DrsH-like family protein [Verrucomicrobia bacterium]|nr:DsrE/DsrF/DrsH-like family protein [Verrucomicrobiota bacterium]
MTKKRIAFIATKGTLDWAYPPFVLASAAIAMGWEVGIFFTFYGLQLLLKDFDGKISPLGNPAMPMKIPFGPESFRSIDWPVPNLVKILPGFEQMATSMMKKTFEQKGVSSIQELRTFCVEGGANLIACQMSMDVFGYKKEEFIPECSFGGAAAFLEFAAEADVQLFI